MAHIAPDQDEDSLFMFFAEVHDSDSSGEQIQSGQALVQQATSSFYHRQIRPFSALIMTFGIYCFFKGTLNRAQIIQEGSGNHLPLDFF